jgi:hypothetical protein
MTTLVVGTFDEDSIGSIGPGNLEPPSLKTRLGPQCFSLLWTSEGAHRMANFKLMNSKMVS